MNCAKCATRSEIGLFDPWAVSENRSIDAAEFDAKQNAFAVELADPDIIGDLADDVDHRLPAAPRTEERKHVDRTIDRPIDILIDHGFNILELALVDRTLQCTRETPETMLCHNIYVLNWLAKKGNGAKWTSSAMASGSIADIFFCLAR